MAFRRQDTVDAKRIKLRVQGISVRSTADIQIGLVTDPTINFGTPLPPDLSQFTDSAVEFSTSLTGYDAGTGECLLTDLVTAGGSGVNKSGGESWPGLDLPVARRRPVVLVARADTGTATVTALLRSLEEW